MLPVLLILAVVFALLFVARVSAARRALLLRHWPVVLLAGAAILALMRGAVGPALVLAGVAVAVYMIGPALGRLFAPTQAPAPEENAADREARAILGVPQGAKVDEIRAAYRTKMSRAHPDRGGAHADAARLTAARDRLLSKRR
jgi:hypothetical protein